MQTGSTNQVELTKTKVLNSSVPVPPAPEQTRLASKLDELFSQIKKGEENLKRVHALVKQYRQSVLKAAVTGELTRDWREAHGDGGESGEELLKHILEARRAAWEAAELGKMQSKGKPPKDHQWKQKYKEPEPPDTTDLPDLPEGWVETTVDQLIISGPDNGLYLPQSRYGSGQPICRIDDYQDLELSLPTRLSPTPTICSVHPFS